MLPCCLLLLSSLALAAPLDDAFARMDRAASAFRGLTARVRIATHTAVVNSADTECGTLAVKRAGPRRFSFLLQFEGNDAKAVALSGNKGEMYLPNINTVQEYDVGAYKGLAEKFFLLGFGSSSAELRAEYTVQSCGAEKETLCIRLVPKSPEMRKHLAGAELWIAPSGYPVRQKFDFLGGDYRQATYTDLRINPPLPDSALKLQLPRGVKRERPQKN